MPHNGRYASGREEQHLAMILALENPRTAMELSTDKFGVTVSFGSADDPKVAAHFGRVDVSALAPEDGPTVAFAVSFAAGDAPATPPGGRGTDAPSVTLTRVGLLSPRDDVAVELDGSEECPVAVAAEASVTGTVRLRGGAPVGVVRTWLVFEVDAGRTLTSACTWTSFGFAVVRPVTAFSIRAEDEAPLNPVSAPFVPGPWRAFASRLPAASHERRLLARTLLESSPEAVHALLGQPRVADVLSREEIEPVARRALEAVSAEDGSGSGSGGGGGGGSGGDGAGSISLTTSTVREVFAARARAAAGYRDRLARALVLEELQHVVDVRHFDLHAVRVEPVRLSDDGAVTARVEIPGLAEKRPSLNLGDVIRLRRPSGAEHTAPVGGRPSADVLATRAPAAWIEVQARVADFHGTTATLVGFKGLGVRDKEEIGRIPWFVRHQHNREVFRLMHAAVGRLPPDCADVPWVWPVSEGGEEWSAEQAAAFDAEAARLEWSFPGLNGLQRTAVVGVLRSVRRARRHGGQGGDGGGGSARAAALVGAAGSGGGAGGLAEMIGGDAGAGESALPPPPFVVFGPPGTGKTVTVVEAAWQLLEDDPDCCLLMCAPSNAAADVLCDRLANLGLSPGDLHRFCWASRKLEFVLPRLLPYCSQGRDGQVEYLPKEELVSKRVVVCTCFSAGILAELGVSSDHFAAVFVDEAGQASELETIVPLTAFASAGGGGVGGSGSGVDISSNGGADHDGERGDGGAGGAGHRTVVVLSGDPRQLGAVCRSPAAKRLGLAVSLLERLMDLPLYASQSAHGCLRTTLLNNYRSHERILHMSSSAFYDSKLRACADPRETDACLGWRELADGDCPVVFWGVEGEAVCPAESASPFNRFEAAKVADIAQDLLASGVAEAPSDFGVVAPYRNQVKECRRVLRSRGLGAVRVGTVDDYQGQEAKIMVISTTVTGTDRRLRHQACPLGIIDDPKRFNVAVSRAKALCVVVGHPIVLLDTPFWSAVVRYCIDSGTYRGWKPVGLPPPRDADDESDAEGDDEVSATLRRLHAIGRPDPWARAAGKGGSGDKVPALDEMQIMFEELEWRVEV